MPNLAILTSDPIFDRLIEEVDSILQESYGPPDGRCENTTWEDYPCRNKAVVWSLENEQHYCMKCFKEVG